MLLLLPIDRDARNDWRCCCRKDDDDDGGVPGGGGGIGEDDDDDTFLVAAAAFLGGDAIPVVARVLFAIPDVVVVLVKRATAALALGEVGKPLRTGDDGIVGYMEGVDAAN